MIDVSRRPETDNTIAKMLDRRQPIISTTGSIKAPKDKQKYCIIHSKDTGNRHLIISPTGSIKSPRNKKQIFYNLLFSNQNNHCRCFVNLIHVY